MAKKRGRKVSHRKPRHKIRAKKASVSSKISSIRNNIRIVLNNLIIFFIFFLISLVLYSVVTSEVFRNLFFIFMLGFGFISVAFLITLLVFLFLKLFRKR
jgi:hypothetical protein